MEYSIYNKDVVNGLDESIKEFKNIKLDKGKTFSSTVNSDNNIKLFITDNDIIIGEVLENGTEIYNITIIKGDLLGKGKPTLGSFSLLGQYLLNIKGLDENQLKAADMNDDGKVSMADFALLGKYLLNNR